MSKAIESTDFTQGTIVDRVDWGNEDEAMFGIVLSSPCDIEQGNASYILIAALQDAITIVNNTREFKNKVSSVNPEAPLSRGKMSDIGKFYAKFIHNKDVTRYFFIDTSNLFDDLEYVLVDFQRTVTLPFDSHGELEVIGKLPSPFSDKMIMHYASHVSRVGVNRIPDNETDEICKAWVPYPITPGENFTEF